MVAKKNSCHSDFAPDTAGVIETPRPPSFAQIGRAYEVTRERARQLVLQHGIEIVVDPGRLHDVLLDRGNRSPLRTLLGDADRRAEISTKLNR